MGCALPFPADVEISTPSEAREPLANGLAAAAYTSEAFLALENERLFPGSWVFVGFAHEMAKPGDVVPVRVAGQPVLLVRDASGGLRAFQNACRHRCLELVDGRRNVGRAIRCPYHSWTYALDGSLRAAPFFGGREPRALPPGFDRSAYGLVPVRSAEWHDWIFVNLDGAAPPIGDFTAALERQLGGLDLGGIRHVATIDLGEVAANWKLLIENFIEPYHVQFVHPKTTEHRLADHYTVADGNCLGSAIDMSEQASREDRLSVSARYLTLFPNFVLGRYFPDQIGVHLNVPLAPNRTGQRRAIYMIGTGEVSAERARQLARLWHDVHREDHAMCERLQRGRAARVAEGGGILSPVWEDSVRAFQRLVEDACAVSPGRGIGVPVTRPLPSEGTADALEAPGSGIPARPDPDRVPMPSPAPSGGLSAAPLA